MPIYLPIQTIEFIIDYVGRSSYMVMEKLLFLSKSYYYYMVNELHVDVKRILHNINMIITLYITTLPDYTETIAPYAYQYNMYMNKHEHKHILPSTRRSYLEIDITSIFTDELVNKYRSHYSLDETKIISIKYKIEYNKKTYEVYDTIDRFNYNMIFIHIPLLLNST